MTVAALLRDSASTYTRLREHLDALPTDTQVAQTASLGGAALRRMWELAGEAELITLEHFVPEGVPDGAPVHHAGRNSIPVLPPFRNFEKRFARMSAADRELVGYNRSAVESWAGPGFFVLREGDAQHHPERGSWLVDYLRVPDGAVPDGWPTVIPNERGLQRFVYAGTQDWMRKVNDAVSIGMPYKGDKCLNMPFVLVRLDG